MSMSSTTSARQLREQLGHPVIDNDGHILEVTPSFIELIGEIGGPKVRDRYVQLTASARENMFGRKPPVSLQQRQHAWIGRSSWWSNTTNTFDRATSMLPKLYEERLGELGIDFAIVYPSEGLLANRLVDDDEVRIAACRAINTYQAEMYRECSRSIRGVAVIPMQTPEEAIAELDHAVNDLGFTVALFASGASRTIPKYREEMPDLAHLFKRTDCFGLDSEHDYDVVWQRCMDLGVAVTFHGSTVGADGPRSPGNLAFNRLGGGVSTYPMMAAGLLLGGVVSRFPALTFAFQEAGVGWACNLIEKFVGMWEKRSADYIRNYNPENVDTARLIEFIDRYGTSRNKRHRDWALGITQSLEPPEQLDDFADLGASTEEEVIDLLTRSFYVGCEADERSNARAYRGNIHGAEVKITFGSDIGHWDVLEAAGVLPEAFELVEDGLIDEDEFRRFTFENAVELHGRMNPSFFAGTNVESAAEKVLAARGLAGSDPILVADGKPGA
jgi:predicted TIM-barrel fold metal-dependent hydrolase